jgi:hypothetical protein
MTDKGKHSPPGAGNVDAEANEVIVKIAGADTNPAFEVVEENCKRGLSVARTLPHQGLRDVLRFRRRRRVTAPEGVRMLMIYSPADTKGMFAAMHALTQEQLMNAELTRELAMKYDTVMIEQGREGRGKGTILG